MRIKNNYGKPWTINMVSRVLRNPIYKGKFYADGTVYTNIYPQIVNDEILIINHEYLLNNIKDVTLISSEATYLLWIDCSKVCENSIDLVEHIRKETGLYLSEGYEYGENGKQFVRMNLATTHARVMDGLNRFKKGIESYQQ